MFHISADLAFITAAKKLKTQKKLPKNSLRKNRSRRLKTLCKNKQNDRVNFRIFSLTFLSSKVITVVKLMFVLTETVLRSFGDFLLKSINFDCDYLIYTKLRNVTDQFCF